MSDKALENAMARRAAVAGQIDNVVKEVNGLIEHHNKLQAELGQIDHFIRMWHDMAGIRPPAELEQKRVEPPAEGGKRIRPKNPPREFVAETCVNYIREAERPLSRAELLDRLQKDGIIIRGKDPAMVLSTMLWRSKDIIRRLPEGGYWLVDQPSPLERDLADLMGTTKFDL
jgi:hypothetical protein